MLELGIGIVRLHDDRAGALEAVGHAQLVILSVAHAQAGTAHASHPAVAQLLFLDGLLAQHHEIEHAESQADHRGPPHCSPEDERQHEGDNRGQAQHHEHLLAAA